MENNEIIIVGTATMNVCTGEGRTVSFDVGELVPTVGDAPAGISFALDPWGEVEFGMDRADEALAENGLTRVGEWRETGDFDRTCKVTR